MGFSSFYKYYEKQKFENSLNFKKPWKFLKMKIRKYSQTRTNKSKPTKLQYSKHYIFPQMIENPAATPVSNPIRNTKWCFTLNADPEGFYDNLETLVDLNSTKIRYICGQMEMEGHLHFQGYIQLKRNQQLTWLKRNISVSAHFEPQHCNINAVARDYCNKENTRVQAETRPFIEYGTFCKGKGARVDLDGFREAIMSGTRQIDLLFTYLKEMARYPRLYQMIRSMVRPTRTTELTVRLNFGGTGLGKSRYAYDNHPQLYALPLSNQLWFDGYDMHKTALLDDFAGAASRLTLNDTLRLLDRYPIQVQVKGRFTWWMPDLIVITTNVHPRNWYKWASREEQYTALIRRLTEVWWYREDEIPVLLTGEARKQYFDRSLLGLDFEETPTGGVCVPGYGSNGHRHR